MEENELISVDNNPVEYTDDNIRHLDDMEHIRVCTSVSWATVRIPKTEYMSF